MELKHPTARFINRPIIDIGLISTGVQAVLHNTNETWAPP